MRKTPCFSQQNLIDVLIVGQGLAGSLLATELQALGLDLRVLDNGLLSASSQVAAGLINPVTGMRWVKTKNLEMLLAKAIKCYEEIGREAKETFWHPKPKVRLIKHQSELDKLSQRLNDEAYQPYLGNYQNHSDGNSLFKTPWGIVEQYQAGYVDVPAVLQYLHKQLSEVYIRDFFDYAKLNISQQYVEYRGIKAKQIVFCEGFKAMDNPWFGRLPWQPDKGDILTIKPNRTLGEAIVNYGKWLLPIVDERYRLGSSHEHIDLSLECKDEVATQLCHELQSRLKKPQKITIEKHQVGVRPCIRGAQPVVGSHPGYPSIKVFNGFGAKGCLLIPTYAALFAKSIKYQQDLIPAEVNVNRFY